jgi:hypothetical protein
MLIIKKNYIFFENTVKFYTDNFYLFSVIPIVMYFDANLEKSIILKDTKNKIGIYRLVNKVNRNSYIVSNINLALD